MKDKRETIIMSVGGSIIVPDDVDVGFLKEFRKFILGNTKKYRFVLIIGGGKVCRKYQNAARQVADITDTDVDWIGIHATRLNASLVKTVFQKHAYKQIITDPTANIKFKEDVLIAAGWEPGCSTDCDAVLLAKNLDAKKIINLTNIDHAYDKDPRKYSDAKIIENMSWKDFRKIVGNEWDPGLNAPFDPVASRHAEKLDIRVIIANGRNLKNLQHILDDKKFIGTTINDK